MANCPCKQLKPVEDHLSCKLLACAVSVRIGIFHWDNFSIYWAYLYTSEGMAVGRGAKEGSSAIQAELLPRLIELGRGSDRRSAGLKVKSSRWLRHRGTLTRDLFLTSPQARKPFSDSIGN